MSEDSQQSKIKIFVVFHKKIFEECYETIPTDVLRKYFTFVAVNENIKKIYPCDTYRFNIIKEWELEKYDPSFQERDYRENSVIYHIYENGLHKLYKYIGFAQYDMYITYNSVKNIQTLEEIDDVNYCLGNYFGDFLHLGTQTWNDGNQKSIEKCIEDYELFFNKAFSYNDIYPLLNTYIIQSKTYERIMKWVVQLYDKIWNRINHKEMCIAALYERVMAMAIGNEEVTYAYFDVEHDHELKRLNNAL